MLRIGRIGRISRSAKMSATTSPKLIASFHNPATHHSYYPVPSGATGATALPERELFQ
jgi:hypothetical protein